MIARIANIRPEQGLADRFLDVCELFGARPAVAGPSGSLSYEALRARTFAVADALLSRGAEPGDRIMMYHSDPGTMIAAIMATLYVGCVYVPVAPVLGGPQIEHVARDVAPRLVLSAGGTGPIPAGTLPAHCFVDLDSLGSLDRPPLARGRATPDSPASILYTSGSTGRRKGIVQIHRNLLHHVRLLTERFAICADDVHSLLAPFIFDASTTDLYCSLLNGAQLVPVEVRERGPVATLARLRDAGVTLLHATPTLMRSLSAAADGRPLDRLRVAIVGGEPLFPEDIQTFRRSLSPSCAYVNGYGATETSGFVTLFEVPDGAPPARPGDGPTIPVGRPCTGFGIELAPPPGPSPGAGGEPGAGEVVVVSRYVAIGYWRGELGRAEPFPARPADPGCRAYATGDVGRWSADGALVLAGRVDRQVKIRGYRADLDEIEAAFLTFPGIDHAAALLREDGLEVMSFIEWGGEAPPDAAAIQAHLAAALPRYLLPIPVFLVDAMPLTVTGKLDRGALLSIAEARPLEPAAHPGIPVGDVSIGSALLGACAALLDKAEVQPHDRFFDIGGDSLSMARLHTEMERRFELGIPLFRYYEFATLGELGAYLGQVSDARSDPRLAAMRQRIARRRGLR